jgi:hypothetical protein
VNVAFAARRASRGNTTPQRRSLTVDAAIVCSAFAALAHFVAAPSHYTWWPAAGVFFVALGVAQTASALLLLRGGHAPWLVLAGIWGTVVVILIYVASRTVGLPMSPPVPFHGGRWVPGRSVVPNGAKYVGPLDLFTLAAELVFVVALISMLPSRWKLRTVNQLMWIGLALWGAAVVGLLR